MFVRNAWYVALRSDELGDKPVARTLLETNVVLFRIENGDAVALDNRCPHRFLPLSMGCVEGDRIRCGYHGLTFDRHGKCVHVPTQAVIPPAAVVRAYPTLEKFGFIWIWMGDAEQADPARLPHFALDVNLEHHVSSEWVPTHGYYHSKSNYLLVVDNLLDLSHVTYVHAGSLSAGGIDHADVNVKVEKLHVRDLRVARDVAAGPAFAPIVGGPQVRIDYWLDMHWQAPSNLLLDVALPRTGEPKYSGARVLASQLVTPETAISSHYYWVSSRNFRMDDAQFTAAWQEMIAAAFEQDAVVLDAQQQNVDGRDLLELDPVILRSDRSAVAARRIVKQMAAAEASASRIA